MAGLTYFTGTMDSGKSTLALQTDHNHRTRGRRGLIFTSRDRAGEGVLSSRLGLSVPAREILESTDLWATVADALQAGQAVDYLVVDEAQFLTEPQVDDLARLADDLGLDVFCFGILTDFRTRLFPGSRRLVEVADKVVHLQVEALCWCGSRATTNARTVDGVMVVEGDQVMVGDVDSGIGIVGYEVLCRPHYRARLTSSAAKASSLSPDPLPFTL